MAPGRILGAYQKKALDFEELLPAERYSNCLDRSEGADAKKWEATSRDWETLAKISRKWPSP